MLMMMVIMVMMIMAMTIVMAAVVRMIQPGKLTGGLTMMVMRTLMVMLRDCFFYNGYTLVLCDPHLSKPWIHSAHLAQGRALPEVRANPPLHRHTLCRAPSCAEMSVSNAGIPSLRGTGHHSLLSNSDPQFFARGRHLWWS